MAKKTRHAYGSSAKIEEALQAGLINAYDTLFLDGDTDNPTVGWIDKDGKAVILKNEKADLSELESELATKADAEEVNSKIDQAVLDTVTAANAYTDEQIENKITDIVAGSIEIVEF